MNRNELSNAAGKIQDAYHYALAARSAKAQLRGHEHSIEVGERTKAQLLALAVDRAMGAGMPIPAKFSRHTFFKLVDAWAKANGLDAYQGEVNAEVWAAASPAATLSRPITTKTPVDAQVEALLATHFPEVETFAERNMDSLDFKEIHTPSLKRAIEAAFAAGRDFEAKRQASKKGGAK